MILVFSSVEKPLTSGQIQNLYNIIIEAYASTEEEMWGENYVRVSWVDFQKHLADGEILVAWLDDQIAGGLRFYEVESGVFSFGLFGADPKWKGQGIGRALVSKSEEEAIKRNGMLMRIEILRPRDFELPIKIMLRNWYQRLGYRRVSSVEFQEVFPERSAGMVTPCVFDSYEKKL